MVRQQKGKPWYIPPKDELLRYADENYTEENKSYLAMKQWLKQDMHCTEAQAQEAMISVMLDEKLSTDPT